MVTALGLAASGVASYLVQRQQVLTIIDYQLLRTVPGLKTIAAGTGSTFTIRIPLIAGAQLSRAGQPHAVQSSTGRKTEDEE